MENLGEISPDQIDETVIEDESNPEKPDFVKKIESFDVDNLTPENIEFMTKTIQDYFLEHFPVEPELVNQLSDRISILGNDEYVKIRDELQGPDDKTGFYTSKYHKIFINQSSYGTPGGLFTTMFHEALHFTSIGAGAGFASGFDDSMIPESYDPQIYSGINTLIEGTTQLIAYNNVVYNMGFDKTEDMESYSPECYIMDTILEPFYKDEIFHIYFQMSMDDLRNYINKIFAPGETSDDADIKNGTFTDCLYNLGLATESMTNTLESWADEYEVEEILKDVRHAVGYYIIRDRKINHKKLSKKNRQELSEYLGSYIEEKDDV